MILVDLEKLHNDPVYVPIYSQEVIRKMKILDQLDNDQSLFLG